MLPRAEKVRERRLAGLMLQEEEEGDDVDALLALEALALLTISIMGKSPPPLPSILIVSSSSSSKASSSPNLVERRLRVLCPLKERDEPLLVSGDEALLDDCALATRGGGIGVDSRGMLRSRGVDVSFSALLLAAEAEKFM